MGGLICRSFTYLITSAKALFLKKVTCAVPHAHTLWGTLFAVTPGQHQRCRQCLLHAPRTSHGRSRHSKAAARTSLPTGPRWAGLRRAGRGSGRGSGRGWTGRLALGCRSGSGPWTGVPWGSLSWWWTPRAQGAMTKCSKSSEASAFVLSFVFRRPRPVAWVSPALGRGVSSPHGRQRQDSAGRGGAWDPARVPCHVEGTWHSRVSASDTPAAPPTLDVSKPRAFAGLTPVTGQRDALRPAAAPSANQWRRVSLFA